MQYQRVTPEEVLRMPGRPGVDYELDRPPYTRYRWDGTQLVDQTLASKAGIPSGGIYLGASYPKKLRRGSYGRKVASWGAALQNSTGTTSFVTGDLPPFVDNATRVLRLDQNAALSFGQQSPPDGSQAYLPLKAFNAGIWVKNPGSRTLNFRLTFFNVSAAKTVYWNAAIEPASVFSGSNGWAFLTFSAAQAVVTGGWTFGADAINFVRVEQRDALTEGPWIAGEYLLFCNAYVETATRPRFLITFDDGNDNQRNPGATSKVSGAAHVSSTLNDVLTTAATHTLVIGEPMVFTETPPTGLTVGTVYWVKTTPSGASFSLATAEDLVTTATTTGFAGTAKYQYGGTQARSGQEIVESYGFRGSLFICAQWLGSNGQYAYGGTVNKFMSAADVVAMWRDGWAVGSHSFSHPSNNENAGLRLLGPLGYYLSNPYDNMPAQYLANWGITAGNGRRRITSGTQASPSVFTSENAHRFLINQPIVFTDPANVPTGCQLGVTYYVASVNFAATTCSLATDQGTLANLVNNTTGAWAGSANYRYPGSAPDDSAILADIEAGVAALATLGITTGRTFFALPQGGADEFVRSACIKAKLVWIRGVSNGFTGVHTIPLGPPSGGGLTAINNIPGGWLAQPDSVQTDGAIALSGLKTYIDDTITMGACGCSYHHSVSNAVALEAICRYLRAKVDAGQIDVLTCDELGKELGIA